MGKYIQQFIEFIRDEYPNIGELEKAAILQVLLQNSHRVRAELSEEVQKFEEKIIKEKTK